MDASSLVDSLLLVVLLGLSAFFSGSETALFSLSRLALSRLENGSHDGKKILHLLSSPGRLLITILIGNMVVNILASAIATKLALHHFGDSGVSIAIGVMTFLLLVFGEITPKTYAVEHHTSFAMYSSGPLYRISRVLSPLISILKYLTDKLVEFGGTPLKEEYSYLTAESLRTMIEVSEQEGILKEEEEEMIKGIMDFSETLVREVMIPRFDMECLNITTDREATFSLIRESGFSRIPVFGENIDDVKGILYAKDLLKFIKDRTSSFDLNDIIHEAFFVPETMKIDTLMNELQKRKTQIAIVVDEYGGTEGLVTMEDLVEEIVGEILDEYDEEERLIERISDHIYLVSGKIDIDELNDELEIELPTEEADSIGGLLMAKLEKVPEMGDETTVDGVRLVVEEVDGLRLEKVRLIMQIKTAPSGDANEGRGA